MLVLPFLAGFYDKGVGPARINLSVGLCLIDVLQPETLQHTIFSGTSEIQLEERVVAIRKVMGYANDLYVRSSIISQSAVSGLAPVFPESVVQDTELILKPNQELLSFLMDTAVGQGLRRTKTSVYKPVKLQDGTFTRCYKLLMSIEDFVYKSVHSKEMNPAAYYAITLSNSTPKQMIDLISHLDDPRFPFLVKDRSHFSFKNGIIDAATEKFYFYKHRGMIDLSLWMNVGVVSELPATLATANFFDSDYPTGLTHSVVITGPVLADTTIHLASSGSGSSAAHASASSSSSSSGSSSFSSRDVHSHDHKVHPTSRHPDLQQLYNHPLAQKLDSSECLRDPFDIPTPEFDKLLDDQKFDTKTKFWLMALMGRLLHNVGTLDDWQVCPYIYGIAGSGKSTILKILQLVYEACDNGTMMAEGETTFCDQHLLDKSIVFGMDIGKTTTLNTPRFNSYISGEMMSHPIKYQTAHDGPWTAPFIFASNNLPPFKDTAGNIARRVLIFQFLFAILCGDGDLFKRCTEELPLILSKMIHVYGRARKMFGNISNLLQHPGVLPEMLHSTCRDFLMLCSPISSFLTSTDVEIKLGNRCTKLDFERGLKVFGLAGTHNDKNTREFRLNNIEHSTLFLQNSCTLIMDTKGVVTHIEGLKVLNIHVFNPHIQSAAPPSFRNNPI
jgi:energy-coupling factor transporter ATP-binding protein EcfA2